MKKIVLLIGVALCLNGVSQTSVKDSLMKSSLDFQKELNEQYSDSLHSPLTNEDRIIFKGHEFYPVDLKYCVDAKLVKEKNPKTFEMKTTTDRKPTYYKYGEVHFKINNKKYKLNVYQSMDLLNKSEYRDYLFLPFKDLTSGEETYGGGRFLDLRIPKGDVISIDFNKAYNPYCAYNHKYSCPVPPPENFLKTEIKAGVRYKH
jgi:uncharacterized protein (DUF1684 family)